MHGNWQLSMGPLPSSVVSARLTCHYTEQSPTQKPPLPRQTATTQKSQSLLPQRRSAPNVCAPTSYPAMAMTEQQCDVLKIGEYLATLLYHGLSRKATGGPATASG